MLLPVFLRKLQEQCLIQGSKHYFGQSRASAYFDLKNGKNADIGKAGASVETNHLNRQQIQLRNQLFEQALLQEKQENYKKALEYYRMSLKIDNTFFDSWLNAGAVYSRSGKSEKAIVCFQRAIVSREDKRAYYNLASEYFKTGRYEDSLQALGQALSQDKNFLQAYLLSGYCLGKLGKNSEAETSIRKVLQLDPANRPALTALALLYFQQNRLEQCREYIQKLQILQPGDTVIERLKASLSLEEGDLESSLNAFSSIAASDGKLKKLHQLLHEQQNSRQKMAMEHKLLETLEKEDKNSRDWFDLSLLAFFSGQPAQAMDFLQKAHRQAANPKT